MAEVLRVGNCSGFYGDRLSAMREMLLGGELDVLTGDYLAELTMLILGRDRLKDPSLGYARTFVRQAEDCLGLALERGVKIVANAGGLNPAGLAERLREVAAGLGLAVQVAHVQGDDLLDRADALGLGGAPLTANAYLGAFGIAAALTHGADVVVTGRVTDASLVVGPAIARFGWTPDVVRRAGRRRGRRATSSSAGRRPPAATSPASPPRRPAARLPARRDRRRRVVRGHQARRHRRPGHRRHGDRAAGLRDPVRDVPRARRVDPPGLARPRPPTARTGCGSPASTGSPPPETLKVCVNELGGFRNQAELVLVGLDVEEKAAWVRAQLTAALAAPGGRPRSSSGRWPAPTTRTPTPRRPRPAGCGSRCATPTPPGSARCSPPRSSSSRWRRTPASR